MNKIKCTCKCKRCVKRKCKCPCTCGYHDEFCICICWGRPAIRKRYGMIKPVSCPIKPSTEFDGDVYEL